MKAALFLTGVVLLSSVCAQSPDFFSSVCRYGAERDRLGNVRTCGGRRHCPFTSRCENIIGQSFGICCTKGSSTQLQCPLGEMPLPGVSCGGFVGRPCPRRYTCVTNPLIADSMGVCCPRGPVQSECRIGKPLPGVTCGGFIGQQCPANYECVGHLLPVDGPGVCCPTLNPEPQCPVGLPLPGERCGGWPPRQCPRRYECITNPLLPDGNGICCPRQGIRY